MAVTLRNLGNDEAGTNRSSVFWMVWSPQGHAPTKQHEAKGAAQREAGRLAALHPGQTFYVLKAIEACISQSIQRVTLHDPQDCPF